MGIVVAAKVSSDCKLAELRKSRDVRCFDAAVITGERKIETGRFSSSCKLDCVVDESSSSRSGAVVEARIGACEVLVERSKDSRNCRLYQSR